ncbi:MAG: hypothetical protein DRJ64_08795 [Thermoprotei archaeon]|nr:MAG: hypothetical protein DRJ64_08795 [Thermoprotei archaeon]
MIHRAVTAPVFLHVSSLFIIWIVAITISLSLNLGYQIYKNIKRKFDEAYNARKVLPKRIIHGIVYIIFLILAYDAVEIRVQGEIAILILFIVYSFLTVIAIFIFGDIVISLYKIIKKKE